MEETVTKVVDLVGTDGRRLGEQHSMGARTYGFGPVRPWVTDTFESTTTSRYAKMIPSYARLLAFKKHLLND